MGESSAGMQEANRRAASAAPVLSKPSSYNINELSTEEAKTAMRDWHDKWIRDRTGGAKNPSPATRNVQKRPLLYSRSSGMTPSPMTPQLDEEDYGSDDSSDSFMMGPPRNLVTAAPLLRPVAVRIARPPSPISLDQSIDLRTGRQEPSPLENLSPPQDDLERRSGPQSPIENEDDYPSRRIIRPPSGSVLPLEAAKAAILHALASSGGDEKSPLLNAALKPLLMRYADTHIDARMWGLEGMWLTLTKPTYAGNLGMNHGGDPMYTLGRMSFDMFQPCQLVCSLQGTFNTIEPVLALEECVTPKALKEEVQEDGALLRTYDIVTAFTIEPYHPDFSGCPNIDVHRPIRGIMTTHGYALPDPEVPNRLTIWFTGGVLQPNNDKQDQDEWKKLFLDHPLPNRTFSEKAMVFAAKMLMGAELGDMQEDGTMTYEFTRPMGGHGMAYVDVLYLDSGLRIVRGHKGTLFVFVKVPDHVHES